MFFNNAKKKNTAYLATKGLDMTYIKQLKGEN